MDLFRYLPVPQEFIEYGRDSLDRILPAESHSRPFDLAQLGLIWPYNIVTEEQASQILGNIETNLVREKGVIRYPGDLYYSADPSEPVGNEAQWPLGLAWLSIVCSKLAYRDLLRGGIFEKPKLYLEKAEHYLAGLEAVMTDDGKVPELYSAGVMNPNVPLAWAQSFYIVASQSLANVHEALGGRPRTA